MNSDPPEYRALVQELKKLCDGTQAGNALIFDHVGLIWCSATHVFRAQRGVVFDLIKAALEPMR